MEIKHNKCKLLELFTVVVVAAVISSVFSKATVVEASSISELTIEDRLTRVREQLKHRSQLFTNESPVVPSSQASQETEEMKSLLSQQQWVNWPNWWNNWKNWSNWNNWNNWRKWGNWW